MSYVLAKRSPERWEENELTRRPRSARGTLCEILPQDQDPHQESSDRTADVEMTLDAFKRLERENADQVKLIEFLRVEVEEIRKHMEMRGKGFTRRRGKSPMRSLEHRLDNRDPGGPKSPEKGEIERSRGSRGPVKSKLKYPKGHPMYWEGGTKTAHC